MDGEHENVGYALVTFSLEVMLCEPHGVKAAVVEGSGNRLGLVEDTSQPLVGEPTVIDREAIEANVVEVDVSRITGSRTWLSSLHLR